MNINFKKITSSIAESLKFSKQELLLFCLVLFISTIVRGPAFFALGYQTDDYALAGTKSWISWSEIDFLSKDGRHLAQVATVLADRLGGGLFGSVGLYPFLLNFALILFSIAVLRLWNIRALTFASLAVSLLIVFFPYNSELFTFKYASFVYLISWLLASIALFLKTDKLSSCLLILLLLILSFWTFQVPAAWVAVVLIFAWIIRILPETYQGVENSNDSKKQAQKDLTNLTLLSSGALLFYVILIKVLKFIFPVAQGDRTKLLEPSQISSRIGEFAGWLVYLIRWDHLIPFLTRVALGILLAMAVVVVILKIFCTQGVKAKVLRSASFLFLLLLSWFASIALVLVVGAWFPAARSTCALGIWWAGIAFLAFLFSRSSMSKILSTGLIVIILSSFLLVSNRALFDQQRLNLRDQMLANRILARMEMQPAFNAVRRVAIIGKSNYPIALATQRFDLNASAFDQKWSNLAILTEISGKAFEAATGDELVRAQELAETMPEWPAEGSIIVDNDLMVIKISTTTQP